MDSLVGLTFSQWQELLRQNHYKTSARVWGKNLFVTFKSLFNAAVARLEKEEWGEQIENTEIVHPPIFILGHWRSGTSMLQNYMALDQQFATPRLLDVTQPNSIVRFHARHDVKELRHQTAKERPMDNIKVNLATPGEDEFALAICTMRSPLLSWVFPKNSERYDRYLTFEGAHQEDVEVWKNGLLYFFKKLTLIYKKQLLLKSPQHTARIHLLLELFPDAKFIHIHRHPYELFKSTKKLYQTAVSTSSLQNIPDEKVNTRRILTIYNEMYDSFFKHKDRIPEGNYIDIAFEEIEQGPVDAIEQVYSQLNLPNFEIFRPVLENKVDENKSYKKNKYSSLSEKDKDTIYNAWQRSFEYWHYAK